MIEQSQVPSISVREATFYTVSDAPYFLGTVGLLNSLRLTGHHNDLVMLDCGLTSRYKEHLSHYCKLVEAPGYLATNPTLCKPFPDLLDPTGVVIIIDSNMIVTRSLKEIMTLANHGKICAFPAPDSTRWFEEWQQLFTFWQSAYVRLLHRLLTGVDAALKVPLNECPVWLRTGGILANLSIRGLHILNVPTQHPILRRTRWRVWPPLKQLILTVSN